MALRVEQRQALGERQWGIVQRCDENLAFLNGQAYPLVDTQSGCARNGCGQAHSEIVAPLLDVQNDFVHATYSVAQCQQLVKGYSFPVHAALHMKAFVAKR